MEHTSWRRLEATFVGYQAGYRLGEATDNQANQRLADPEPQRHCPNPEQDSGSDQHLETHNQSNLEYELDQRPAILEDHHNRLCANRKYQCICQV
jgi:hypothetical protein